MQTNAHAEPLATVIGVVGPDQACKLLDCGITQLYELINAGEVDSFLLGRCRKITLSSIDALIRRRLTETPGRKQKVPDRHRAAA